MAHSTLAMVAAVGIAALMSSSVRAQAWLPETGTLRLGLAYSNYLNKKHYLPDGGTVDVGHTRTQSLALSASYAATDRLMVSATLPFVAARYEGRNPHPVGVDDGHYHGTFTDLRLSVHYQASEDPLAFAPYIAAVVPTHGYASLGHAAPGRDLKEAWFGFYAGKSLDAWLPRTYLQGRYNYAFVERVAGISHDRSNAELEIGHFVNPRWSFFGVVAWQDTHGGIDVPVPRNHELFDHHDRLADESFVNVGAGFALALSPLCSMYALYLSSLEGRNGHKVDNGATLGITYQARAR